MFGNDAAMCFVWLAKANAKWYVLAISDHQHTYVLDVLTEPSPIVSISLFSAFTATSSSDFYFANMCVCVFVDAQKCILHSKSSRCPCLKRINLFNIRVSLQRTISQQWRRKRRWNERCTARQRADRAVVNVSQDGKKVNNNNVLTCSCLFHCIVN